MPGSANPIPPSPPSPIDLTRYTEGARRQLYDAVVVLFFPESSTDPEEWVPPYSPDDAGLTVFQALSRWFITWEAVEERHNPDLPPYRRQELMAAYPDPEARFGVSFHEV
jgi:hypothetical protein